MIIGWRRLGAISVFAMGLSAVACDSGAPSKTRDEIAADSALASDLALANRDTLLVDSIGELHRRELSKDLSDVESSTAKQEGT